MKIKRKKAATAAPVSSPPPPDGDTLRIVAEDAGRGTATVAARLGGEPIHVDTFNLSRAKDRDRFAAAVADLCPALEAADVAAELLRARDRLTAPANGPDDAGKAGGGRSGADAGEPPELDPGAVVRPDGFVTAGAAGIVVLRVLETVNGPEGRNTLYLSLADGAREVRELAADGPAAGRIDLPDGRPLYVHPLPPVPTAADARELAGWSRTNRAAWPDGDDAPDPAELLGRVRDRFVQYLSLPAEDRDGVSLALACWTLATYCASAFPAVPLLHVTGPLNSGKTRAFDLLGRMAFRPLAASNLTAPALFRTLHARGGTLLLDEAERLNNPRDPAAGELLSMLLAGYKRGGRAIRLEPVGDSFRPVAFEVFGFKALAGIATLPPTLASRCLTVRMVRAEAGAAEPKRDPEADAAGWAGLRDDLHCFALAHGPAVRAVAADPPDAGLSNRDRELWTPLLAVAAVADAAGFGGAAGVLIEHAARSVADAADDAAPEADAVLLETLHRLTAPGNDPPRPSDVLRKARLREPEMFDRWSARGVSARLKQYGFRTAKTRGLKVYRDATPARVADAARRYGIDLDGAGGDAPTSPGNVPDPPRRSPSAPRRRRHGAGKGTKGTSGTSGHVPGKGAPASARCPLTVRKAK